jgi:hypothetical protein
VIAITPLFGCKPFLTVLYRCEYHHPSLRTHRAHGGTLMTPEERQRMNSLSLRIQDEKDYCRFEGLVVELNEVIGSKQQRFSREHFDATGWRPIRPWKAATGIVRKLLTPMYATQPQKIEISIPDADNLFREIRIANSFISPNGGSVALKAGVLVHITIEADLKDTVPTAPEGSF